MAVRDGRWDATELGSRRPPGRSPKRERGRVVGRTKKLRRERRGRGKTASVRDNMMIWCAGGARTLFIKHFCNIKS